MFDDLYNMTMTDSVTADPNTMSTLPDAEQLVGRLRAGLKRLADLRRARPPASDEDLAETAHAEKRASTNLANAFEALDALLSNGAALPTSWDRSGAGRETDPDLWVVLDANGNVVSTARLAATAMSMTGDGQRWLQYVPAFMLVRASRNARFDGESTLRTIRDRILSAAEHFGPHSGPWESVQLIDEKLAGR